ncbi:chitin synthase regulatory factor Chr3 [Schizosaccharomyces japonicus yFS275]|uniref:Chitin synthase regulatory factor Chr3 n=1 Tax=Schizosaccharomyces japonicus (strain yFS275 / FY16936) TaxID=402676 RepID=B6K788_SCHJY|nr:chitin synthase regulatory factor Chr3 [Schizosaccharomyces japonicus yFS275]EEB09392.1 chitin synthase regulatory factor Chr3 [Schizosaccharomyces japonicus yFS275]
MSEKVPLRFRPTSRYPTLPPASTGNLNENVHSTGPKRPVEQHRHHVVSSQLAPEPVVPVSNSYSAAPSDSTHMERKAPSQVPMKDHANVEDGSKGRKLNIPRARTIRHAQKRISYVPYGGFDDFLDYYSSKDVVPEPNIPESSEEDTSGDESDILPSVPETGYPEVLHEVDGEATWSSTSSETEPSVLRNSTNAPAAINQRPRGPPVPQEAPFGAPTGSHANQNVFEERGTRRQTPAHAAPTPVPASGANGRPRGGLRNLPRSPTPRTRVVRNAALAAAAAPAPMPAPVAAESPFHVAERPAPRSAQHSSNGAPHPNSHRAPAERGQLPRNQHQRLPPHEANAQPAAHSSPEIHSPTPRYPVSKRKVHPNGANNSTIPPVPPLPATVKAQAQPAKIVSPPSIASRTSIPSQPSTSSLISHTSNPSSLNGKSRVSSTSSDAILCHPDDKVIVPEPETVTHEQVMHYEEKMFMEGTTPQSEVQLAKYYLQALEALENAASPSDLDPTVITMRKQSYTARAIELLKRNAFPSKTKDIVPEALFLIGQFNSSGTLGFRRDPVRAFDLYNLAAKRGHPQSIYRVAVCLQTGTGVKQDYQKCVAMYKHAADYAVVEAMYKIGLIHLHGLFGEPKNPALGIQWLQRACKPKGQDAARAMYDLAQIYEQPQKYETSATPKMIFELYKQSAIYGYPPAQYKLGECFEHGYLGIMPEPRRSIFWYTKAAENDYPEAELGLSGWYLTGADGLLPKSEQEAMLWAHRAATKGLAKAQFAVGYMMEKGIGVPADPAAAHSWYLRAANQGFKKAKARLSEQALAQKNATTSNAGNKTLNKVSSNRKAPVNDKRKDKNHEQCIIA